jgi:hypothetical protein
VSYAQLNTTKWHFLSLAFFDWLWELLWPSTVLLLIKLFCEGISKFMALSSFLLMDNFFQTVSSLGLVKCFNNFVYFWILSFTQIWSAEVDSSVWHNLKFLSLPWWFQVIYLPWDLKFTGSNPAEVDGLYQDVKVLSTSPLGGTLNLGPWIWDFRLVKNLKSEKLCLWT